ncbi:MAG: lipid II flippase MurJ [Candidatus Saccharibacteria bacterium]|nr:lipid II flippase MurJ [Candidatus Saccharibacteria bacterium]
MKNRFMRRTRKKVSLGSAATLLIVMALSGQILGFLRNRLISTNFTVVDPGSSDALFAAFVIPDFFFYTIAAGALGVAFIPFLSDKIESSDKKGAWDLASSLLNLLTIVMGFVAVIILIFAEPLMGLIAPNLPPDHFQEAVMIMRLLSLNPLLFTVSGLLTAVQQTFGRFFFYAIAPLTYNAVIIMSIYLFRDTIGIVGLGVGALIGGLLQLSISLIGLYGLGFRYKPVILWRKKQFREVLKNLPPRSLDQGIDQVNNVVEINRAQTLGIGAVSSYSFALTLMHVPIILLGNSIAIAAFPRFTERLSQNRPDLFRKDFLEVLRTIIWVTMPVIVVCYFARAYLARLIFGDVAPQVALIFGFLVVAIFFRIIYAMISRYFYAYKDTKTPLFVSIFAIGFNIFLAFTLSRPEAYGIAGLAIAQSIVATSEVVILSGIMLYRDRKMFQPSFVASVFKIISVTGFTLVATFIMLSILPLNASDRGFVTLGGKLALISSVTMLTHLVVSRIFDLSEAHLVINKAYNIIMKPIRVDV